MDKCYTCTCFASYPIPKGVFLQKGGTCELFQRPTASFDTCDHHEPITEDEHKAIIDVIYQRVMQYAEGKLLDGLGQQRDMETTDRADSESIRLDGDGQPEIPGGSNS